MYKMEEFVVTIQFTLIKPASNSAGNRDVRVIAALYPFGHVGVLKITTFTGYVSPT